ncbi:DUF5949 family protein [Streptomyces sp. A3M-1-3]|uniref:DUF5949 family protein n=1 Tax=Streptomyces sp. A3M-1-3 TaxID=2962044 RepID=UPI0020B7AF15|nr:DUF5949 family protein [Streptomyces sp. A3M-1-3]MCP3820371.1 DUF5949 family protein [Streptomyces sp. A3M-1-3]
MTSTHTAASSFQRGQLGTLSVLTWIGDPAEGQNIPYLLAFSLGDGTDGPEAGEAAVRALIVECGLSVGGGVLDGTRVPSLPVKLLVEGGQAVLNMPYLSAQCPAPPEWLQSANEHEEVYFLLASRPWPEATPGKPVSEEMLKAFVGDEQTLTTAAHCLLPVTRLRK